MATLTLPYYSYPKKLRIIISNKGNWFKYCSSVVMVNESDFYYTVSSEDCEFESRLEYLFFHLFIFSWR